MATGPDRRRRDAELAADAELVEVLRTEDFDGPAWSVYREPLAGYGFDVLLRHMRSRRVFELCRIWRVRGWRERAPDERRFDDDGVDIACETVARAVNAFRKDLRAGKWSPDGGATLRTYFYRRCVFEFAGVYRAWLRDVEPTVKWETLVPNDAPVITGLVSNDDPTREDDEFDDLCRRLDGLTERQARMLRLLADGSTQAQIAKEIRVSVSTVERDVAKLKRMLRPGDQEPKGGADA
jgi:RNA polymerase sigma factor (sigma-70 family)